MREDVRMKTIEEITKMNLSKHDKYLLILRYVEELNYNEIGRVLGCSPLLVRHDLGVLENMINEGGKNGSVN